MGRTSNRRAANSANRRISAAVWFYGQSFHANATDQRPAAMKDFPPLSPEDRNIFDEAVKPYEEQRERAIAQYQSDMLHDID